MGRCQPLGSARIKTGSALIVLRHTYAISFTTLVFIRKLNLRLQNRFTHRYALIFWEVCFDYFDIARNQGETPFIPMETFRDLMGLDKDDYPLFKEFNRNVIKPAIQEINALTNFFIEIEPKRIGRKICELKFRISRLKEMPTVQPTQETFSFDIDDLPSIAIKLVQAGVSRKEALRIADQAWDAVDAGAVPEESGDFAVYVEEKIGLGTTGDGCQKYGWVHCQGDPGKL